MLTLFLTPLYNLPTPVMAATDHAGLGGGTIALRDKWPKSRYEFILKTRFSGRVQAQEFFGFAAIHKGSRVFWFDGASAGNLEDFIPIVYDESKTQVFLPNDNIYAPTLVIKVNGVVVSGWTLDESIGLLTFTSAPAANAAIEAKYRCKFKAFLIGSSDPNLYEPVETEFGFEQEIRLREMPETA